MAYTIVLVRYNGLVMSSEAESLRAAGRRAEEILNDALYQGKEPSSRFARVFLTGPQVFQEFMTEERDGVVDMERVDREML